MPFGGEVQTNAEAVCLWHVTVRSVRIRGSSCVRVLGVERAAPRFILFSPSHARSFGSTGGGENLYLQETVRRRAGLEKRQADNVISLKRTAFYIIPEEREVLTAHRCLGLIRHFPQLPRNFGVLLLYGLYTRLATLNRPTFLRYALSRLVRTHSRYIFNGNPAAGYSLMDVGCFDNYSHTHEMAHNLGCYHDRANSNIQSEYSHGWRYCTTGDFQ